MNQSSILRESEVQAEFAQLSSSEFDAFFKWSGLGTSDFDSAIWGLSSRAWAVSDRAAFAGGFRVVRGRDSLLSAMFYMKRFLMEWGTVHGSDPGTDQRLDDMRMNLESAGGDPQGLLEAEALASQGWRAS